MNFEHLSGSQFNDNLTGDAGDNNIFGQDGDDTINGGVGDDQLFGNGGSDTIAGGEGQDVFIFNATDDGNDIINGFETAIGGAPDGYIDRVDLTSFGPSIDITDVNLAMS